jgi:hypothetical protein
MTKVYMVTVDCDTLNVIAKDEEQARIRLEDFLGRTLPTDLKFAVVLTLPRDEEAA